MKASNSIWPQLYSVVSRSIFNWVMYLTGTRKPVWKIPSSRFPLKEFNLLEPKYLGWRKVSILFIQLPSYSLYLCKLWSPAQWRIKSNLLLCRCSIKPYLPPLNISNKTNWSYYLMNFIPLTTLTGNTLSNLSSQLTIYLCGA